MSYKIGGPMHEGVLRSAALRDAGDRADGTFGYILDFTDGCSAFWVRSRTRTRSTLSVFGLEPAILLLGARACRGPHGSRLRRRCWDRARGTGRIRISPEPGWSRRCTWPRRHGVAAL